MLALRSHTQCIASVVSPLGSSAIKRCFLSKPSRTVSDRRGCNMAAKASLGIWVKGDPENKVLGDCPFSHRALLTMEEKKLEYERDYIDFAKKPDWLLEVNPEGSVPVLKDGEKWVVDSGTIVEYLEENYPLPSVPADEEGDQATGGVFKAFREFLFNKEDSEEKEKEAALVVELAKVDALLKKRGGPFLGGESFNAADASVLPKLYHMKTALGEYKKWTIPDSLPNLLSYIAKAAERPSWKNTDYGTDMILKGWGKHFS
ncbi:hypothetical protein BSKO_07605 [Bryopsis sp. KO-2023]|nr:hypothetical protein BSKO_07605 [Bryopsis sp. KO-2023]